jgi:hypothetical protein
MNSESFPTTKIKTARDISIFEINKNLVLVVGCDSAGGIGPKPLDKVKVSGYTLGRFTARVALMEVLSVGAKPFCLTNTLGVEPDPTGLEIVRGIQSEVTKLGLPLDLIGSMEKTVEVQQTGIGVTVVGLTPKNKLRIGMSLPNDSIVAVGFPNVKEEVMPAEERGETADLQDLLTLINCNFIHDVIPVGSLGIKHEVKVLCQDANLAAKLDNKCTFNIESSAGPATVVLVTVGKDHIHKLSDLVDTPVTVIGTLFSRTA